MSLRQLQLSESQTRPTAAMLFERLKLCSVSRKILKNTKQGSDELHDILLNIQREPPKEGI